VAREERLGFWEPMVTVFRGWALSELGQHAEGLAQIRPAVERYLAAGNGILQVWMHAILAEVQWKAGECTDAFTTLASAMTLARRNGEGLFEPELHRLEGVFRFAQAVDTAGKASPSGEDPSVTLGHAERCIRESLDLARRQSARMLELRSLVSLCRVRRALGAVGSEVEELAAAYAAFTEGLEAPDLREARAMLQASKASPATSRP
jgi:adenylate cyclase